MRHFVTALVAFPLLINTVRGDIVPGFELRTVIQTNDLDRVSGIALDGPDTLLINHDGKLSELNLVSEDLTTIQSRSGLEGTGTGMIIIGDGRSGFGVDTYLADHNFNDDPEGVPNLGTIFRRSATTGVFSQLSSGLPDKSRGDPFGLGFGPTAFGDNLYVMDFQGASLQPPFLYTVAQDGTSQVFVEDATQWTNSHRPQYLEFTRGRAGFPDVLLISDAETGQIWEVGTDASLTGFLSANTLDSPRGMRFGPGGFFGDDLFVLDTGSRKLVTVTASGVVGDFATDLPITGGGGDIAFSAGGNRLYIGSGDSIYEISAIPEPTTFTALVLGSLLLFGRRVA